MVGDVDLATLPRLASALDSLGGEVTIDLRSVDFIDPVCLGALVAANLRAGRRGGSFTVVATGAVEAMLEESGLTRILTVVGDLPPAGQAS